MRHLSQNQQEAFEKILRRRKGKLTPTDLFLDVKSWGEDCPLHSIVFDCGDGEAVLRHRIAQCSWIIRHAKFRYHAEGNPEPMMARRVLNVEHGEKTLYLSTERALKSKEHRVLLKEECSVELIEWRDKWAALLGVGEVLSILKAEVSNDF